MVTEEIVLAAIDRVKEHIEHRIIVTMAITTAMILRIVRPFEEDFFFPAKAIKQVITNNRIKKASNATVKGPVSTLILQI